MNNIGAPELTFRTPEDEERWALVQRVATSALFHRSPKLRDFLLFVCANRLTDQLDQIREQQIGSRVFGRRPDYNMSEDAIVRVEARELRRRLAQYFETEGKAEPFVITIPKGGYTPDFVSAPSPSPSPVADGSGLAPAVESLGEPAREASLPGSQGSWTDFLKGSVRRPALGLLLLLLGCMAGLLFATWFSHRPSTPARGRSANISEYNFYKDLLGPVGMDTGSDTLVVLSNPRLVLYFGSDTPKVPGMESRAVFAVPPALENLLKPATNDLKEKYSYRFAQITSEDYTGMGEAVAAFQVGQLMQILGGRVRLQQSRFLNWGSARKEHLIFLGSPHMSEWTQRSLLWSNFKIVDGGISNANPLPGEQALYAHRVDLKTAHVDEDYGLIWMARSASGTQLLVLAGRTSTGTAGVGDFFGDPERMRPVYSKLKASSKGGSLPSNWQVLLKISARDGVPVDVAYVTHRLDTAAR